MGLDIVELFLSIEDAFGVQIPDEDARDLLTIDALTGYLVRRFTPAAEAPCATQRAFYALRRVAAPQLGVAPRTLAPGTPWATVLPEASRRAVWRRLGAHFGQRRWPRLEFSRTAGRALLAACVATSAAVFMGTGPSAGAAFGALLAFLPAVFAFDALFRPWARTVPAHLATVGDTARYLAVHAPVALQAPPARLTEADVRATVRQLVIEHLSMDDPPDNAHFVRDLGAG